MSVWIDFKDVIGLSFLALVLVLLGLDAALTKLRRWREPKRCTICHGSRRVCENCRDKSWPDECHCGAGMNCPLCAKCST